jgi:flagellar basal-body rod protein FlgF
LAYGIYVATAGAVARQTQLDLVANNLANADTAGYRSQEVSFNEVLHDATEAPHRHMVAVGENWVSMEPGPLVATQNPRDLAIEGSGFFSVSDGGFQTLTRSLTAQVGPDGRLVDAEGRTLLGQSGPIFVDRLAEFHVDEGGQVVQDGRPIDRLRVVDVSDPRGLVPLGGGGYQTSPESGTAFRTDAKVVQGALEGSNVRPLDSMIQLIQLQRDYQSLSRAITAYRQADEELIRASRG